MKKIILCLIVLIITISKVVNAQSKESLKFYMEGLEKLSKDNIPSEIDNAIIDFKKAIELSPDYAKAHEALGLSLLRKTIPIFNRLKNEKMNSRDRLNLRFDLVFLLNRSLKSFESSYKCDNKNIDVIKKMLEIYLILGMDYEYEEMKRVYDSIGIKTYKI